MSADFVFLIHPGFHLEFGVSELNWNNTIMTGDQKKDLSDRICDVTLKKYLSLLDELEPGAAIFEVLPKDYANTLSSTMRAFQEVLEEEAIKKGIYIIAPNPGDVFTGYPSQKASARISRWQDVQEWTKFFFAKLYESTGKEEYLVGKLFETIQKSKVSFIGEYQDACVRHFRNAFMDLYTDAQVIEMDHACLSYRASLSLTFPRSGYDLGGMDWERNR